MKKADDSEVKKKKKKGKKEKVKERDKDEGMVATNIVVV